MVKSKVGTRISIGLLDKMVVFHEAVEGSEAAKAFDVGSVASPGWSSTLLKFMVRYAIVSEIIETGLLPDLYKKFTMSVFRFLIPFPAVLTQPYRTNEIIIPHQTTLLKLLDSFLQSLPNLPKLQFADVLRIHESLGSFLAKRFFGLSEYAQKAIHKSLGMTPYNARRGPLITPSSDSISSDSNSDSDSNLGGPLNKTSALQQINLMLVKACEGLVLVTQCMVTVTLGSEMQRERIEKGDMSLENYIDMKSFFNRKKYQESGMAESLIGALSSFQRVAIRYISP